MIKNYTNETIFIKNNDKIVELKSIGIAKVSSISSIIGSIDNMPILRVVPGPIKGLPNKDGESTYIVSRRVLNALNSTRDDVVSPDYESCDIDENGTKTINSFIIL